MHGISLKRLDSEMGLWVLYQDIKQIGARPVPDMQPGKQAVTVFVIDSAGCIKNARTMTAAPDVD